MFYGMCYMDNSGGFRDCRVMGYDGKPVERTKDEYRYNYDPFLVWAKKDSYIRNTEGSHAVYSDRLIQWDYTKYNKCRREVFGNEYQTFSGDSPDQIEKFLRLYNDNPKLELIKIAEGCNVGNGYPYWMFWYKDHK